jgi:hypothetical protein
VRGAAARFSGAWPYLRVIAELLDCDPLDERAVRAYWTGSAEGDAIDRAEFWSRLLAIIGPQAGSYWAHLTEALVAEAAPHHAFHVFGVYPWTRLLITGRPEPVEVLESCAILPAEVVELGDGTTGDGILVRGIRLSYRDGQLHADEEEPRTVSVPFGDEIRPGDAVTVHWGAVAEVTDPAVTAGLQERLVQQLERVNARLAAS